MRTLVVTVVVATLGLAGCKGADGPAGPRTVSEAQTQYAAAATEIVIWLPVTVKRVEMMEAAFRDPNAVGLAAHLAAQKEDLDKLDAALARMNTADELLASSGVGAGQQALIVELAAAAVWILSTLSFTKFLRDKNAEATKQREELERSCAAVANNEAGAIERCQQARGELNKIGGEVTREVFTKVVTDGAFSGVDPTTLGGVLLKEGGNQLAGKGLDVLTATRPCATNPRATDCRIGATSTDPVARARTPAGELTISVSGGGRTRVVLEGVEVLPARDTTVAVTTRPIEDTIDAGVDVRQDVGAPPEAGRTETGALPDGGAAEVPEGNHFPVVNGATYDYAVNLVSNTDGTISRNDYTQRTTVTVAGGTAKLAMSAAGIVEELQLTAANGGWTLREVWVDGMKASSYSPAPRYWPMNGFVPTQTWKESATVTVVGDAGMEATAAASLTTTLAASYTEIAVPAGRFNGALVLTRDQSWTYQPRQTVDGSGNQVTVNGTRTIVDKETFVPGIGLVHRSQQDDEFTRVTGGPMALESSSKTTVVQQLTGYRVP